MQYYDYHATLASVQTFDTNTMILRVTRSTTNKVFSVGQKKNSTINKIA